MGLSEHLKLGAKFDRGVVQFQVDPSNVGTVNLGSAYALLGIETDIPCRFRLYDDQVSRDTATEVSRSITNTSIGAPIALVGDFSMSSAGFYYVDPCLYGVVHTASANLSYYRAQGSYTSPTPTIKLTFYRLENSEISTSNRTTLEYFTGSLVAGALVSGIMSSFTIPKTYLLLRASITDPAARARLRLYSTSGSLSIAAEVSRSFSSESIAKDLIADIIITGSETTYFSPKIIGANLQTIDYFSPNLSNFIQNEQLLNGVNPVYYIIQNVGTSSANISASLHVFSLEN